MADVELIEPAVKRAFVFIDGQNLYYSAKNAGICKTPDYDVKLLSEALCIKQGWECREIRFYTGIPDTQHAPGIYVAWQAKLARMQAAGIITITRPLRYSGTPPVAREKGIDVRIALDVVRLGRLNYFDVGLIVSQDQDLREAVHELREIAIQQQRWIKLASTYVERSDGQLQRGIYDSDWIAISHKMYEDTRDVTPFYSSTTKT